MNRQRGWRGVYVLIVILFLLLPIQTKAQTSVAIDNLSVALWPEYDRPDVLVMYRVELSPDVSLPAQLTFKLPGYVDQMHAVAMNTDEGLINVGENLVKTSREGDDLILSFPTSSPNIQFEYYDPVILTKQNENREFTFDFSVPYNTAVAGFEIQQPFGAESFALTPEPKNTITGGDQLKYSTIIAENLAEGEEFQILATYQRNTDDLSLQALQQGSAQNVAQNAALNVPAASPAEISASGVSPNIAYGLIGLGAVLLFGAGGYWWYTNNRSGQESTPQRRAPQKGGKPARRKREKSNKKQPRAAAFVTEPAAASVDSVASESAGAAFCYKCGAAFRSDANFCYTCGTKRRV